MLKGVCKKCGEETEGWPLRKPVHRVCNCGGEIEVSELTVTTDAGEQLLEKAEEAFIESLRRSTFYLPQDR